MRLRQPWLGHPRTAPVSSGRSWVKRGKPLSEQGKASNRTKSAVRARVEHVFGAQTNDMGGTLVRTIGLVRAKAKIGMKNLAYNMRRLAQLRRLNPSPA